MIVEETLQLPQKTDQEKSGNAMPEALGFSNGKTGGHMARSMMMNEISKALQVLPEDADPKDFKKAIEEENCLGMPTFSSRKKSFSHLVELYGLDPKKALFRVLRKVVKADPGSLPISAMICSYGRDTQLRHSFKLISTLRPGEILKRIRMEEFLEEGFPSRFSAAMKRSLAQNVNTTWTYSGHLEGRAVKKRSIPTPRPASTAYAMFAGFLLGLRSQLLLNSEFVKLAGVDAHTALSHLSWASNQGWLRLRNAGGVTEIDFSPLLTTEENTICHE